MALLLVILYMTELFIDVSMTLKRLREIVEWNEPAANTYLHAGFVCRCSQQGTFMCIGGVAL